MLAILFLLFMYDKQGRVVGRDTGARVQPKKKIHHIYPFLFILSA